MEATIITAELKFKGKVIQHGDSLAVFIPFGQHSQAEQFQTEGCKVELSMSDEKHKHKPVTINFIGKVAMKGQHEKVLLIPAKYRNQVKAYSGKNVKADIRIILSVAKW
jgi:hypothetical protein